MILRSLAAACAVAALCVAPAFAQSSDAPPPDHPPLALVETAIADAPGVSAASADIARARAAGDRLRAGDYELELAAGYARRNVSGGDRDFDEWNGGLRRSIRWPDKRSADVALASVEVAIAEAAYDAAWRTTALEWASLWTEWRASAALVAVAEAAAQDAETLADGEARRVAIGSGRALDRDRLAADAALARLAAEQAERRRADAESALAIMFPTFVLPTTPPALEEPAEPPLEATNPDDVLAQFPAVREARLRVEQADLQARRARMDLRPDPTVGLEAFSEFNGDETGLGVSVSIPITGRARRASAREAEGGRSASLAGLRAVEQRARQRYSSALLRAQSAARAVASASTAAGAAREAVSRIERGRAINAASVTEVIAVRQAARAAETARLEALAEAAGAELELGILEGRLLAAP